MRLTSVDSRINLNRNHNFNAEKMFPIETASDLNLFDNLPQHTFNEPPSRLSHKKVWKPFNSKFLLAYKKKKKEKSWLDMINPFECESDYYDDDEYDDD